MTEPSRTDDAAPAATSSVADPAEPVSAAELARLGLAGETDALEAIGLWPAAQGEAGAARALREIAAAPNAVAAARALARLVEAHPSRWEDLRETPGLPGRLAMVLGSSDALLELVQRTEAKLDHLCGDLEAWDADEVRRRTAAALAEADEACEAEALASVQRTGLLRTAARDLLGLADTPTASAELADLAEGVMGAAVDHVADGVDLAVIGMGKLGGRELNYVSDVDVLFVARDRDAGQRAAERFLRLLGAHTPHGRPYEVDANLRPEGRDGPLVRTLDGYRSYYERWAHQWELQALLKARPVAGDAELGAEFCALIAPFVWPDRLDGDRVAEIQRMKERVEHSKAVRRDGARQVKLAPGGIRDIEFAVQLLQLVHGRLDPDLRAPGTLPALRALAEAGYVDEGDAALFQDAYQFLRTLEHRLQLLRLRRTHTVPSDEVTRERIARAVGFRDIRVASALEQFDRELSRVQGYVRRLHEKLFFRPLLDRFAEVSRGERLTGEDGRLDEEAVRERLRALGFGDPAGAVDHLNALAAGVSRRARLLRTTLPALLPRLAASADPDGGLAALRRLTERLEQSPAFLRTLADTPPVAELLVTVLGASQVVGEWLQRQPEVFTELTDLEALGRPREREELQRVADGLRRRGGGDPERASALLRKFKRREAARLAVRDLGGMAELTTVCGELTALAEACLEAGVAIVTPPGVRLAVIGMGKLGGGELGYASDLDVLLVHEGDGALAAEAAERLIPLLGEITPEGSAFAVDLKLRPEGTDGPLTRSLEGYERYYERWSQPWELQALTQARPVAGDAELGARFTALVEDLVYPDPLPVERLRAMRTMKARVESERSRRTRPRTTRARRGGPRRSAGALRPTTQGTAYSPAATGAAMDVKLGPGGLSDVEWTVQLLQQRHGGARPALRRAGTLAGLHALIDEGLVDGEEASWLREGWERCSRVRNARYLAGARDTSAVPQDGAGLERLARMLGYPQGGGQQLLDDLARTTRRVRKVHERLFYD